MSNLYIIENSIKSIKILYNSADVRVLLFQINEYVNLLKENKISYLEECKRVLRYIKPYLKTTNFLHRNNAQKILWQLYKVNPNIIKKGVSLNLFLIKDPVNINFSDALKFLTEIALINESLKSLVIRKFKDCLDYHESENVNDIQNSLTLLNN
jgi:hypothetical protein